MGDQPIPAEIFIQIISKFHGLCCLYLDCVFVSDLDSDTLQSLTKLIPNLVYLIIQNPADDDDSVHFQKQLISEFAPTLKALSTNFTDLQTSNTIVWNALEELEVLASSYKDTAVERLLLDSSGLKRVHLKYDLNCEDFTKVVSTVFSQHIKLEQLRFKLDSLAMLSPACDVIDRSIFNLDQEKRANLQIKMFLKGIVGFKASDFIYNARRPINALDAANIDNWSFFVIIKFDDKENKADHKEDWRLRMMSFQERNSSRFDIYWKWNKLLVTSRGYDP